jgi:hypothetical protein
MGKTAFRGPVYGAKSYLFGGGPVALANGSTTLVTSIVVPPYESWVLTEAFVMNSQATSNSSNNKVIVKVKGTSTSVSYPGPGPDPDFPTGNAGSAITFTGPTSTATYNQMATATVTAGEYEGYVAPANSTVRIVSSGTIGAVYIRVNGFVRYLNSTRSE